MVCAGRESGQTAFILFDCDWNRQTFIYSETGTSEGASFPRPEKLEVMLNLARDLAKDMPFVRVDLYYEGGRVYFGEMTMYPESGFDWELLPETDRLWGDALLLPGKSG
jgi:hypothetical protein